MIFFFIILELNVYTLTELYNPFSSTCYDGYSPSLKAGNMYLMTSV